MMPTTFAEAERLTMPEAATLYAAYVNAKAHARDCTTDLARDFFMQRAEGARCQLVVHYPEIAAKHGLTEAV